VTKDDKIIHCQCCTVSPNVVGPYEDSMCLMQHIGL